MDGEWVGRGVWVWVQMVFVGYGVSSGRVGWWWWGEPSGAAAECESEACVGRPPTHTSGADCVLCLPALLLGLLPPFNAVPCITKAHFEESMKYARRSVSDADIR